MGAWGITVRQSDDGLDLLDTIVVEQLRKVNFTAFNVSEAITLLNQTIQEKIEQYRQKPPSKITDSYINGTLMHDFTNAATLVAECLYDYYQTGELVVYDYVGENYDPVEYAAYKKSRHKKEFRAEHETEIAQHEAAKRAFDALGGKPIPKVAQLPQEYAELLAEK